MSYRALISDIKNQSIKNVMMVFGTETYLIDKALESLRGAVVTAFPELNYTVLEGDHLKLDQLANACETFPFGCDRKLVLVRDLYALKSSGKGEVEEGGGSSAASTELQGLLDMVANSSDSTCLVFVSYGSIDKRKKLFNEIKKRGAVYEFDRVEREEFITWVKNILNKAKKQIKPREVDYFVSSSGYLDKNSSKTLYDVENELKKLVSFMGNDTEVTMAHISAIMPKNIENDIFKLINACSERRVSDSLRVYSDLLLEGESSLGILAMLSKQIKNIISVQELYYKGYESKAIADMQRLHEFTVKLCIKYCDKIKKNKLINAFSRCVGAEMSIKSGKMSDRLAIEMLLVTMFD